MASILSALFCAIAGFLLWTGVGWLVARRLALNPTLALPCAPALGWAVQNVLALALSLGAGFSWLTIIGGSVLAGMAAVLTGGSRDVEMRGGATLAPWIYLAAALLALAPAAAVLPKFTADGVVLAAPIFDHAKVALIDEIMRGGVPPGNPVFGAGGARGEVAYYYLWHFGAAQLGLLTGSSGWEADIASSWFSAFASLCLMAGLALNFGGRAIAPVLVLAACCTGSVRPALTMLFGADRVDRLLEPSSGLAGWLFQITWSPHHVQAAGCAVLACLLIARLATRPTPFRALVLALVVAAGFGSSIWVGGIVFAVAGSAVTLTMLGSLPSNRRLPFLAACLAAAVGAAAVSAPLLSAQAHAALARGAGAPILVDPFHVLGPAFPDAVRRLLDLPAYWVVLLAVELPVIFGIGAMTLARCALSQSADRERTRDALALGTLALVSLACGWLLVSTAGENNDLGWRAVLPAIIVLTASAAAGISRWMAQRAVWRGAVVVAVVAAALPDGAKIITGNITGQPAASSAAFKRAPSVWQAVRRHTPPYARVASNPLLFQDLTPWPVNISWALLAHRRSCFAGNEMALAFAPLTNAQREEMSDRFIRVFAGNGSPQDVDMLAGDYGCRVVLVTSQDGAWNSDPFAGTEAYRLMETEPGQWRIYTATGSAPH